MPDAKDRIKSVFHEAMDLPTGERPAFLARRCGADALLRAKVETLLRAHNEAGAFMTEPANGAPHTGPGTTIGRYKLLQTIGEGGFGIVYMAEQKEPVTRRVALKVIKLGMDTKQVVARFEAERQALAMMDHPNIARVLDAGETEAGRPYFVMELVRGVPITEFCDKSNLGTADRLRLFVQVCGAMQHAHQKGVIHRDVKPSNVLVTLHDGVPVPKVIDFGIAKAIDRRLTEKTLFTEFQQVVGTPEYMSPEQAEMSGLDIDTRADVYSLGVLLYELLTGTKPFDAETLLERGYAEMIRVIREVDPPTPSTRVSSLGRAVALAARHRGATPQALAVLLRGDLDWIVMKALEKDRTRRYDSASAFADDVRRHLDDEAVLASPPSGPYRLRKFVRRNRTAVATSGLVAVALVAGTVASLAGFMEARDRRRDAENATVAAKAATADALARRGEAETARGEAVAKTAEAEAATRAKDEALRGLKAALRQSEGQRLVAQSATQVQSDPACALALAIEGAKRFPGLEANNALLAAMDAAPEREIVLTPTGSGFNSAVFAAGGTLVVVCGPTTARVFDAGQGIAVAEIAAPPGETFAWGLSDRCASHDGRRIAIGLQKAGLVRIYDLATGARVTDLPGHGEHPNGWFSPHGRWILTTSADHGLRLWDAAAGELVHTLETGTWNVCLAHFSSDGRFLTTSEQREIRTWDLETGQRVRTLGSREHPTIRPVVSADGRFAAAGSYEGKALVWDLATGEVVRTIGLEGEVVGWVDLDATGSRIAACAERGGGVWDVGTGRLLKSFIAATSPSGLRLSPDGSELLVNCQDGTQLVDVDAAERGSGLQGGAFVAQFAPKGLDVLVTRTGGLNTLTRPRRRSRLTGHKPALLSLAFHRDGSLLASGAGGDGLARVWDVGTGECVHVIRGHALSDEERASLGTTGRPFRWVNWVAFDSLGATLATGSTDGSAALWSVATGQELRRLRAKGAAQAVWSATWSPDGRQVATGGTDCVVRLWDAGSGEQIRMLGDRDMPLAEQRDLEMYGTQGNWSPDGRWIVTRTNSPQAVVYEAATGRVVRCFEGGREMLSAASFSPDGKRVLISSMDVGVRLAEVATGDLVWQVDGIVDDDPCRFSRDGRFVLVGTTDGLIRVVNAADGSVARELRGHTGYWPEAEFSRDGQRIVSSAQDGTIRLWDAASGKELLTLRGTGPACFSPDGRLVAVPDVAGVIRLVPTDVVAAAKAAKPRDLTDEERRRFEVPQDE